MKFHTNLMPSINDENMKRLQLILYYTKMPVNCKYYILPFVYINFRARWSHVFGQTDSTILNPGDTLNHNAGLFQPIPLSSLLNPSFFFLNCIPTLLYLFLYIFFDQFSRGRFGIRATYLFQWQLAARFRGRYDLYTTYASVPRVHWARKADLNPRLRFQISGDVLRKLLDEEENEGYRVKS